MKDQCISSVFVMGTLEQIKYINTELTHIFGKDAVVNQIRKEDKASVMNFTITNPGTMPQVRLTTLTNGIHDTEGLHIKVEGQNLETLYFDWAIFSYGFWTWEPMPDINGKILILINQGIRYIKKYIETNGNVDFGKDCIYSALYINDDGYAECPCFRRIEMEDNKTLTVLLSDGIWLYEDQLTPNHVLDILSMLSESNNNSQHP